MAAILIHHAGNLLFITLAISSRASLPRNYFATAFQNDSRRKFTDLKTHSIGSQIRSDISGRFDAPSQWDAK